MATIHVVHGYIAFGKTTLAKKLAVELPAVHLNADDWIIKLYGKDLLDAEFNEKAGIVVNFLWEIARKIIDAGADVIMDIGPWSKQMRTDVFNMAKQITPNIVFHTIVLDPKIARERLVQRNKENKRLDVTTLEFFDRNLQYYEPVSDDEGFVVKRYYQDK
ncbi:MAG: ATP-binding protein [Alphaproteobacteria bacterium]|nr:ATP-binding protein [Alphaproteobacteria bacterium]